MREENNAEIMTKNGRNISARLRYTASVLLGQQWTSCDTTTL